LSPFLRLKDDARYDARNCSFLMVASKDLSMDFWSSARPSANFFFSGFSPCLKNASSPFFFSALSAPQYLVSETFSRALLSRPLISTEVLVAMT